MLSKHCQLHIIQVVVGGGGGGVEAAAAAVVVVVVVVIAVHTMNIVNSFFMFPLRLYTQSS